MHENTGYYSCVLFIFFWCYRTNLQLSFHHDGVVYTQATAKYMHGLRQCDKMQGQLLQGNVQRRRRTLGCDVVF